MLFKKIHLLMVNNAIFSKPREFLIIKLLHSSLSHIAQHNFCSLCFMANKNTEERSYLKLATLSIEQPHECQKTSQKIFNYMQ